MKTKIILVLLPLFYLGEIACQVSFGEKIEFDIKEDEFGYHKVHLFGKDGFVIRSVNSGKGIRKIKYELFDTQLKPVKHEITEVLIPKSGSLSSFESKTHFVDVFYEKDGKTTIIGVEGKSLESTKTSVTLPKQMGGLHGEIDGDYIYLLGYVKRNPMFVIVNWQTGSTSLVPIILKGYSAPLITFGDMTISEKTNEIFLSLTGRKGKNEDIFLCRINKDDGSKSLLNLSSLLDKRLMSISANGIEGGKYILTGTYSSKPAKVFEKATSEGIYYAELEGDKINFIKYHNFTKLKNFLTYLPEKKQDKIEKKKAKNKAKGKETRLSYYLASHDLIMTQGGSYYLGEAYYRTYRSETYQTMVNGQLTTQTRQVFDGFQYTHATLVRYNSEGDIIWDQTFEMWPGYKPFRVKKFISVSKNVEKSIAMVFASHERLYSKSFSPEGEVLEDEKSEDLSGIFENDEVRSAFSQIDSWYDNHFLAYGKHTIINKKSADTKRKRHVFLIAKVSYAP